MPDIKLRVVTLNLWGTHDPLAERLDEAARQLAALDPDLVFLQEVRQGEGQENTAGLVCEALPTPLHWRYQVAVSGPPGTFGPGSAAGEEGLAIASRHAIGEWRVVELPEARPTERRILLSARIDVAGCALWAHTTHLHWRPGDEPARIAQVQAIGRALSALPGAHLVGGDFNATADAPSVTHLCEQLGFRDLFAEAHPDQAGATFSSANPGTQPLAFLGLDRRIDFLFARGQVGGPEISLRDCRLALDEPSATGVYPSDHFAVVADIELTGAP